MANRRMLPHTVTIFKAEGEGLDYKQKYKVTVHEHVYCPELVQGYDGQRPANKAKAYFFDTATTNMASFALEGNGNEYIVPGNQMLLEKPPQGAYCVLAVKRHKAGSPRMWHWEVQAK